jgi:hypothetical protein
MRNSCTPLLWTPWWWLRFVETYVEVSNTRCTVYVFTTCICCCSVYDKMHALCNVKLEFMCYVDQLHHPIGPCHGSGGSSPASYRGDWGSIPSQWTKWQCDRFISQYFGFRLSVPFRHYCILVHSVCSGRCVISAIYSVVKQPTRRHNLLVMHMSADYLLVNIRFVHRMPSATSAISRYPSSRSSGLHRMNQLPWHSGERWHCTAWTVAIVNTVTHCGRPFVVSLNTEAVTGCTGECRICVR